MGIKVTKKLDGIRRAEATFSSFLRQTTDETEKRLIRSIRSKMREDTGDERDSIRVKASKTLLKQHLLIYSDLIQAQIDEFGRRAGAKYPPFGRGSVLRDWVKRRINPPEKQLAGVTFLVARKIHETGIEARRPFGRTFDENKSNILRAYGRAIDSAVSVINRKG